MKILKINGTEIQVTDGEFRVINLLKNGVCPGSAFEQGSGRYKRTDMPRLSARREKLGILLLKKTDLPQHEFFATHPRHQFAYVLLLKKTDSPDEFSYALHARVFLSAARMTAIQRHRRGEMNYYTATEFQTWEPTKAGSLSGAKAVASKRNAYIGTTIHVAVKYGSYYVRVAVKRNGEWQNIDAHEINE